MSKVDAMRAIKQARYDKAAAGPAPGKTERLPVSRPAAPAPEPAADATDAVPSEALCGHRNMGGKSCTRPLDHQRDGTKNHRYG